MATTKKRVNITLTSDMEEQVTALANLDKVPTATKIAELLRQSLELEEDRLLSEMVAIRRKQGGKTLSHKDVWGTS